MPARPKPCPGCGVSPPPATDEERESGEATCFVCGRVRPVISELNHDLFIARLIELRENLKGVTR